MSAIIRKIVTVVEETHLEMGQKVAPPTRRAAAIAVTILRMIALIVSLAPDQTCAILSSALS